LCDLRFVTSDRITFFTEHLRALDFPAQLHPQPPPHEPSPQVYSLSRTPISRPSSQRSASDLTGKPLPMSVRPKSRIERRQRQAGRGHSASSNSAGFVSHAPTERHRTPMTTAWLHGPRFEDRVFRACAMERYYQGYSMNVRSNQVNITNTPSSDGEPYWSPDGSKIAFASDRDHAVSIACT